MRCKVNDISCRYWFQRKRKIQSGARSHQVSTDKVYGKGLSVREWLYVEEHCKAINPTKIHNEFGWLSETKFEDRTQWNLNEKNQKWLGLKDKFKF